MARKKKRKTREPTQPIGNTVTGDLGPEQLVSIAKTPRSNSKSVFVALRREALRRLLERSF